jgi:ATP synthase protein I
MSGSIGWAVALPTLLGVAVGTWIDQRWPSHHSWTLMLLFAGLIVGCVGAWMSIDREQRERQ